MDLRGYIECMYFDSVYIELLRLRITPILTWILTPKGCILDPGLMGRDFLHSVF